MIPGTVEIKLLTIVLLALMNYLLVNRKRKTKDVVETYSPVQQCNFNINSNGQSSRCGKEQRYGKQKAQTQYNQKIVEPFSLSNKQQVTKLLKNNEYFVNFHNQNIHKKPFYNQVSRPASFNLLNQNQQSNLKQNQKSKSIQINQGKELQFQHFPIPKQLNAQRLNMDKQKDHKITQKACQITSNHPHKELFKPKKQNLNYSFKNQCSMEIQNSQDSNQSETSIKQKQTLKKIKRHRQGQHQKKHYIEQYCSEGQGLSDFDKQTIEIIQNKQDKNSQCKNCCKCSKKNKNYIKNAEFNHSKQNFKRDIKRFITATVQQIIEEQGIKLQPLGNKKRKSSN